MNVGMKGWENVVFLFCSSFFGKNTKGVGIFICMILFDFDAFVEKKLKKKKKWEYM